MHKCNLPFAGPSPEQRLLLRCMKNTEVQGLAVWLCAWCHTWKIHSQATCLLPLLLLVPLHAVNDTRCAVSYFWLSRTAATGFFFIVVWSPGTELRALGLLGRSSTYSNPFCFTF
jgi:hypothetical protein